MKKQIFTLWVLVFLILFLGNEYRQTNPGYTRFFVQDSFLVGQMASGESYILGDPSIWDKTRPLGYFYPAEKTIKLIDIEDKASQGKLTRWSKNFAVLNLDGYRLFWFEKEFAFTEIQALPISFQADIWISNGVVPPIEMPLPKTMIWNTSTKKINKKLMERLSEKNIKYIETSMRGFVWMNEKNGVWEN